MRKMNVILAALTGILLLGGMVSAQNEPRPKTQKELDALKGIDASPSLEIKLQKIDAFLGDFPNSEFKQVLLDQAVGLAADKGDYPLAVAWGERDLDANPNSYVAMMSLATVTAKNTKEFDLDKDQKLIQAEKWARGALEALKTAEKPYFAPEEKWQAGKKSYEASCHQALGLIALVRKKFDVAAQEFQTAYELQPEPSYLIREGEADIRGTKYDDAIAIYDKVLAMPDLHPVVKRVAENERRDALRRKGVPAAAPTAAPATPGQASPAPPPPSTPPPASPDNK